MEHGTFLDEEGIELMAERGTFLIPTLYTFEAGVMDESPTEKDRQLSEMLRTQCASSA